MPSIDISLTIQWCHKVDLSEDFESC
jgi:hypothetical protein